MKHLLDNIVWHALSGPHLPFSSGAADAKRYAQGFSPILGFADIERPNFAGIDPHCVAGEKFYTDAWSGPPPAPWRIEYESTMFKMVWDAPMPADDAPDAVMLQPRHAAQALELALLTRPGPFGPRTPELGDFFGYFEGDRLVAMAGERMQAGMLREVSGVCTHPDAQGQGLARKLMTKLIRRQMQRGETTFLHVIRTNERALGLYRGMGFSTYRESTVRVITRD